MPNRKASRRGRWRYKIAHPLERLVVEGACGTSGLVPGVEEWQLVQEDDGLNGVQPCCVPLEFVPILFELAVLAERTDPSREGGVVRHEGSRVAEGPKVFRRIETEGGGQTACAGSETVTHCAVGLASIFDEADSRRFANGL